MIYVAAVAIAGLGALLLAAWGLRGRRLDDHPVCRRCAYDLLGRARAACCPECGADLARRRALRRGRRRRRPIAIGTGAVLAMASAGAGGWISVQASRGFDFNTVKPLWMLRAEASAGDAAALRELIRRVKAKAVGAAGIRGLVQAALAAQADRSRAWDAGWGDLIEIAEGAQLLSPEDWSAYRRNAAGVSVVVRPRIREGDPLPVIATLTERLAAGSTLRPAGSLTSPPSRSLPWPLPFAPSGQMSLLVDMPERIGPGRHRIELWWRLSTRGGDGPEDAGPADRSEAVSVEVDVLGPEEDPIELVRGEDLRREVAGSLRVVCRAKHTIAGRRYVQLRLWLDAAPVDCAFELLLRDEDRRGRLGRLVWRRSQIGAPPSGAFFDCLTGGFDGPRVDLILRPDRAAAAESMDLWRICGEEIVVEDVPVEWW